MRVGLRLLIFTVHPMAPGATLMSSFLFNVALVLLATNAAIQFCAQAFALYANETAIHNIWGNQARSAAQTPQGYACKTLTACDNEGVSNAQASLPMRPSPTTSLATRRALHVSLTQYLLG